MEEPEPVAMEEPEPVAHEESEPAALSESPQDEEATHDEEPSRRPSVFGRLLRLFRRAQPEQPAAERAPEPEPEAIQAEAIQAGPIPAEATEALPLEPAEPAEAVPEAEPEPAAIDESNPAIAFELLALEQALDSLGQAHHRPFSRA
jgi:hypothetical protein